MKKLKLIIGLILSFSIMFTSTNIMAAISSSDVSLGGVSSVNEGESFTVSVSGNGIGTFSVSVSNGSLTGISGAQASSGSSFVKGLGAVTLSIQPNGSGTVTVTVSAIDAAGGTEEGYMLEGSVSKSVSVISKPTTPTQPNKPSTPNKPVDPVKTYNLNLASLEIEGATLSPEFSADTVDYEVEFPKGTTSITINAKAEDSNVSVQGNGEHEVHEGDNTIELTTHHKETSSTKTYRIHAYVEEEPKVFIPYQNKQLGVYPSFHGSEELEGFENIEIQIGENNVIGKINDKGLTLLYLVNEEGEKSFYVYKEEKLFPYKPITLLGRTFISLEIPEEMKNMKGLIQQEVIIDEISCKGWAFEDESFKNYSLVYLMDDSGNAHIYQCESTEGVLQLYSNAAALKQVQVDELQKQVNIYKIVSIVVSCLCVAIVGGFFVYMKKKQA